MRESSLLIGYPRANGRGGMHPARAAWLAQRGCITYGHCALSTIILASGYGAGGAGDITGKHRKSKRARATGAGDCPDYARAQAQAGWQAGIELADKLQAARALVANDDTNTATARADLAALQADLAELCDKRAAIVQAVLAESSEGKRLLALAGGAGWGDGRRVVTLNSGGMAARAARYVKSKRGHEPSDTSLQEAAASAVSAMWLEWTVLQSVDCATWEPCTLRRLGAVGWRAAFHSFRHDAAQGRKGSRADELQVSGDCLPLEQATLQVERESLNSWARDRQGRIFDSGAEDDATARAQRRRVLKWIASVLQTRQVGKGAGAARAAQSERQRFSVLARLVHGRDIATAARGAGFASGRACLESFRSGKVWDRLGAAIGARVTDRDKRLQAARARAVTLAMVAIFVQRATARGARAIPQLAPSARRVIVSSGASCIVPDGKTRKGARVIRPAARRVYQALGARGRGHIHPLARLWSEATEARGQAVATARAARAELLRARAQRLADFKAGTVNLRAGWLRT